MEVSRKTILTTVIPALPWILATYVLNKLGLSAACDKQDARVEVATYIVRLFTGLRRPIGLVQRRSVNDPGVRGRIWVSKVDIAGESEVRRVVDRGIQALGSDKHKYDLPDVDGVSGEWVGFRVDAGNNTARPEGSEEQQYVNLMNEVKTDLTLLFFHGGGYFMMDPATYRGFTYSLAKRTGGRVFALRYRLAPQHPFPAALIDALTSYLYLLSPPKGAYHEAIPAEKIVFAGDSAGGNLASALGLLLVTLKREGVESIRHHGVDVPLELPAGLALLSPWVDIGRSLPSIWTNARYDYLHPPGARVLDTPVPPDDLWPSSPPRVDMFCQAEMLTHPLVSPVAATPDMWKGMPPVLICGGNETLQDEFSVLARNVYLAGSAVEFRGYEGMPHCFPLVVMGSDIANHCIDKWAKFCINVVDHKIQRTETASWWKARTRPFKFYEVKLATMGLADDIVQQKLRAATDEAIDKEQKEIRDWKTAS